jgi:hypothetical protein
LAQEAQQNPALQNPAVMRQVQDRIGQMQNHASQLQSQGVPAAQAMQHAAQRFTPPGAVVQVREWLDPLELLQASRIR